MARLFAPGLRLGMVVALALVPGATPALAQTRLYLLFAGDTPLCRSGDCEPPRVLEIDVDGRRILAETPVLHARENATPPVVTTDGRYLAWIGTENRLTVPSYLSVFDTGSRWQSVLATTSVRGYPGYLFADPAAVRLFTQFESDTPLTVVEPQGFRRVPVPCASAVLTGLSGDGARIFVQCQTAPPGDTFVLDSVTGATGGRFPAPGTNLASNDDGREVYMPAWVGVGVTVLRRWSVAAGTALAERTVGEPGAPVVFDARTRRVFLSVADTSSSTDALEVYDGDTLALVSRTLAPFPHAHAATVVDPERDVVYVVWYGPTPTGSWQSRIVLYDMVTSTIVAEAALPNDTRPLGMVLGPRPPRATGLAAIVTGSTVTLQWTNAMSRTMATGLMVEAGSASGLSNLSVLPVAAGQTTLRVAYVPRGTYYVRVRSVNGTGAGEPSNEVVVTVP